MTFTLPPEVGGKNLEMSSVPIMYHRAQERIMSHGARITRAHVDIDNTKDLYKDKTGFFAAVELTWMGVKPTDLLVKRYQEVARQSAQAGRSEDGLTFLQVRAKNSANLLVEFTALEEQGEISQVETSKHVKVKGVAYRCRRDYPRGSKRKSVGKVARYNRSTSPRMPCQMADSHITHGPNRKRRRRWWPWCIAAKVHVAHACTQTQRHMTAHGHARRRGEKQ